MKEVKYWEAEDGTRFDNEYDCEKHERHIKFMELLEIVPCYTNTFVRMTSKVEDFDEGDIHFILIPDKITPGFDEALRKLDEEFFEGVLPYTETKLHNDLLYWDEWSGAWRVWSGDHKELRRLADHFQLFGEGE